MPIKTLGKAAEGGGDSGAAATASDSSPAASGPSIIPSQVYFYKNTTNLSVSNYQKLVNFTHFDSSFNVISILKFLISRIILSMIYLASIWAQQPINHMNLLLSRHQRAVWISYQVVLINYSIWVADHH